MCLYFWRTQLNYLENKNGRGWVDGMQLGKGGGGGLWYGWFVALKRWETTPNNIAILKKMWLGGDDFLLIKKGITWLCKIGDVSIL